MIKIYTWVHGNPKSHQINDLLEKIDTECNHTSKFIEFPEISTTVSGWTYATPPAELMSTFYKFIKQQLEHGTDYVVLTFSTLTCDVIRLASKDLNLKDQVEIYDEKMTLVTSVGEKGRMYNPVEGLFDAEEQVLLKLL